MAEKLTVLGASGASATELARKTGNWGVLPTDSDYQALSKLGQALLEDNPGFQSTVPGPAGPTFTTLAAFRAAPPGNKRQSLADPAYPFGDYFFETANPPYVEKLPLVIRANDLPLSAGAWVRQKADAVTYRSAAVAVTLDNELWAVAYGVSPANTPAGNTAALNTAIAAAISAKATLRLPGGRIQYNGVSLPDAACSLHIIGAGRPKSYSGGVNGDQTDDPGTTLVYTPTTGDAFGWTLSADNKRVYLTLENLTFEGNPSATAGSGVHLSAGSAIAAFLVSYNRVTVRRFKDHGIWHDGNIFESRLDDVRINYAGGSGFKASFNSGGIPGETTIAGGYYSFCDKGIDLAGGGKWSLIGVSSSYNTTNNVLADGVQVESTGLQTEAGNLTSLAADSILVKNCRSPRFIATSQAVRSGATGNGMRFQNVLSPWVCGHTSNSSVAASAYRDIRFDDDTTRGAIIDDWADDFADRVSLGLGGGHSRMRGGRAYTGVIPAFARSSAADVTPNAQLADVFFYTATGATLTIQNPVLSNSSVYDDGRCITIHVINAYTGPITVNWGQAYLPSGTYTPPAAGARAALRFRYDNAASKWVQE